MTTTREAPPQTVAGTPPSVSTAFARMAITIEGVRIHPDFVFSQGVTLRKRPRRLAVKYLLRRDGNRCAIASALCIMDGGPFANPYGADIDHVDRNRKNHMARNLRLACHPCNASFESRQRQRDAVPATTLCVRRLVEERTMREEEDNHHHHHTAQQEAAWLSKEGEKADRLRPAWDALVADPTTWLRLGQHLGLPDLAIGRYVRLKDLVDYAAGTIPGRGSSVTYRRYADEDRFTKLELTREGGGKTTTTMVRYRVEQQKRKEMLE